MTIVHKGVSSLQGTTPVAGGTPAIPAGSGNCAEPVTEMETDNTENTNNKEASNPDLVKCDVGKMIVDAYVYLKSPPIQREYPNVCIEGEKYSCDLDTMKVYRKKVEELEVNISKTECMLKKMKDEKRTLQSVMCQCEKKLGDAIQQQKTEQLAKCRASLGGCASGGHTLGTGCKCGGACGAKAGCGAKRKPAKKRVVRRVAKVVPRPVAVQPMMPPPPVYGCGIRPYYQ